MQPAVRALRTSIASTEEDHEGREDGATAVEAVGATLKLFDACCPQEDATITLAGLEAALRTKVGRDEDVAKILLTLGSPSSRSGGRLNFLDFWQVMDCFLDRVGMWTQRADDDDEAETIRGMRRFRDGVLAIQEDHQEDVDHISSEELLRLLEGIRESSSDPEYWDDVMSVVSRADNGGRLKVFEVAEAVYVWLQEEVRESMEGDADGMLPAKVTEPTSTATRAAGDKRMSTSGDDPWGLRLNAAQLSQRDVAVARSPSPSPSPTSTRLSLESCDSTSWADMRGAVSDDVQRAQDLTDRIARLAGAGTKAKAVHKALEKLAKVHESMQHSMEGRLKEASGLQRTVEVLQEKKTHLQTELERTYEVSEDSVRELERQRDHHRSKAASMEQELRELREQCEAQARELRSLQAEHAEVQCRSRLQRDRCAELEEVAASAEDVARRRTDELERFQGTMLTAQEILRSFAASAEESDEVAAALQEQLLARNPPGSATTSDDVREATRDNPTAPSADEPKKRGVEYQVRQLRIVRDELLDAHKSWASHDLEDTNASPRELQKQRRISFLASQLDALARYTSQLEHFIDAGAGSARSRPADWVCRDSALLFDDLSERLHTVEVQKADADVEVGRLRASLNEKEAQLQGVQRHRDQLLMRLHTVKESSQGPSQASSTVSGLESTHMQDAMTDASSRSSERTSPSSGGFLFSGSEPLPGSLQSSPLQGHRPAAARLANSAKKLIHVHRLADLGETDLEPEEHDRHVPAPHEGHKPAATRLASSAKKLIHVHRTAGVGDTDLEQNASDRPGGNEVGRSTDADEKRVRKDKDLPRHKRPETADPPRHKDAEPRRRERERLHEAPRPTAEPRSETNEYSTHEGGAPVAASRRRSERRKRPPNDSVMPGCDQQ